MPRILISTMKNSVLLAKILSQCRLHHYSLPNSKNPFIFTNITFLRNRYIPKESKTKTNRRQLSDKLSEKGRGDEANFYLRVRREQFMKIKERKIIQIEAELRLLEAKLSKIGPKTTSQQEEVKQKLLVEIKELKATLKKYKKSVEEDKAKY
ncbi:uncharacterized protein [Drosophila kikkawai]|uniref:39S ribosomal protein L52, mitochondrial n=1 Tax=Drosophila kikkawai TaxID=30033 RepID=A0A6P4IPU0_DROKI|nr:uncharacterized protein LOC108076254 isoform X2 [Drosophila kikkawai]